MIINTNKGQKQDGDPSPAAFVPPKEVVVPDAVQEPESIKAVAAKPVAPLPASQLDALMATVAVLAEQVKISSAREMRLNAQEEQLEAQRAAKRKQYANQGKEDDKNRLTRQARCKHLKGGKNRRANAMEDFLVSLFTYASGETVIRCMGCGMKWRVTDTKTEVVRDGMVYKNHTGIGWTEALAMVHKSTNTASCSEIPAVNLGKVKVQLNAPIVHAEIDTNPIGVFEATE